jgi:hypothetical protein
LDDPAFEMRVGRLFAEAPAYPDSPLFALQIESRLGRGWALRRTLIAAAGACGGVLAVGQTIGSGLIERLSGFSHMLGAARAGLGNLPAPLALRAGALADMPFGGEVVWLILGLALLAGALLFGRSLEEI